TAAPQGRRRAASQHGHVRGWPWAVLRRRDELGWRGTQPGTPRWPDPLERSLPIRSGAPQPPHRPEQILPIRGGLHRGGVRGVVRTLVIWAGAGAGAVI